jgi:penicillin-binding protein 1A
VLRVQTASGKVLYERPRDVPVRVISAENDAYMTQMMVATLSDGTGKAAVLVKYPAAGKTGTSQDYRDAWFVGFTADYITGVWIGNDDGAPMKKATGGGLPSRTFKTFMQSAERPFPPRELTGLTLFAPEEEAPPQPGPAIAETPKPEPREDVLSIFQNLLDRLF